MEYNIQYWVNPLVRTIPSYYAVLKYRDHRSPPWIQLGSSNKWYNLKHWHPFCLPLRNSCQASLHVGKLNSSLMLPKRAKDHFRLLAYPKTLPKTSTSIVLSKTIHVVPWPSMELSSINKVEQVPREVSHYIFYTTFTSLQVVIMTCLSHLQPKYLYIIIFTPSVEMFVLIFIPWSGKALRAIIC